MTGFFASKRNHFARRDGKIVAYIGTRGVTIGDQVFGEFDIYGQLPQQGACY